MHSKLSSKEQDCATGVLNEYLHESGIIENSSILSNAKV